MTFAVPGLDSIAALSNPLSNPVGQDGRGGLGRSVLFIDAGVTDRELLAASSGAVTYLLDSGRDAVGQITEVLAGWRDLESVQIVSHGRSGGIELGGSWVDLQTLPSYVDSLKSWGRALSEDGDILLYGCNVARGREGREFVNLLADVTGADLGASENLTGNSALGGDWDLEYQTGKLNSVAALVQANKIEKYDKVLNDATFTYAQQFTGGSIGTLSNVVFDIAGNRYISGTFRGTVDFDPGSNVNYITSNNDTLDTFISKFDNQGNFEWVKTIGNLGSFSQATNILNIDTTGNIYITGSFYATVDFDPSNGVANLTSGWGSSDIFVCKLDSNGNYVWAKSMGGKSNDIAVGITEDSSGSVYITGHFSETADFDPSNRIANLISESGSVDIFVCKLDSNGNYIWAKSVGGSSDDKVIGISADASDNIYITGSFVGTFDFDPGLGTKNLTSKGKTDIFINKLDSNGDLIWAKSLGGASNDEVTGISIDSDGSIYTTGIFTDTSDFDPGTSISNLSSNSGSADIFISKLDSNGDFVWAKGMGSDGNDTSAGISVDKDGNIYTAGIFSGMLDFYSSSGAKSLISNGDHTDIFLSKLDAAGNFVWAENIGGTNHDGAISIGNDRNGNIYAVGYFSDTVDFDPGDGSRNLAAGGKRSHFLLQLNNTGGFINVQQWLSGEFEFNSDPEITVDAAGNIYTIGTFIGTVDFDPGIGIHSLTSAGNIDNVFISKLDSNGNFLWAKSLGGNGSVCKATDVTIDSSGNVYTAGYFSGMVDFNPGGNVISMTSEGYTDIFIIKLDNSGNFVWVKRTGGIGYDGAVGISIDSSANIYTTGQFFGTVDFDSGPGTVNLAGGGMFVSKIDSNGNLMWAKNLGGPNCEVIGISIDSGGNVYTTGHFYDTVDFDPGPGIVNLTGGRIFISKLDSSGNLSWAKNIGNPFYNQVNGISVDSRGNVYTTGYFYGTADFDPGSSISNLTTGVHDTNIFISKLDSRGNFAWAKNIGGNRDDQAMDIVVDSSDNLYITGYFEDLVDFDPDFGICQLTGQTYFPNVFVNKIDSDGNFAWAKGMSASFGASGTSIGIDRNGEVYTTGYFKGRGDSGIFNLTTGGVRNIFLSKLSQVKSQPDLLLRNTTSGEVAIWGLNGSEITTGSYTQLADGTRITPDRTWQLISAKSDFNGDRINDLVWFNSLTTETAIWYMQLGSTGLNNIIGSSTYIYTPQAPATIKPGGAWQLTHVTDLLGDSRPEFLWEDRTNGYSAIWELTINPNGRAEVNPTTSNFITLNDPAKTKIQTSNGWKIVGIGNFDSDRTTRDLLWFNETTTETALWHLNSTTLTNSGFINANGNNIKPGLGWKPVAIANLDSLGPDEILWQNGDTIAIWQLNSNFTLTNKSITLNQKLTEGEQIQGIIDIDLDGSLELVVRRKNTTADTTRLYTVTPGTFQISVPTPPRYITRPGQTLPLVTGDSDWDIIDLTDFGGPTT
jgi:Domain of unknown function (DUF4347)/Beta-propeller repeat